jgi:SpoVK/Ycf46/Vps4 family AAA+-type ATPase
MGAHAGAVPGEGSATGDGVMRTIGTGIAQKLVQVIVCLVISYVASVVVNAVAQAGDGTFGGGEHERAVGACLVDPRTVDVSFADVGGLDEAKRDVYHALVLPLRHPHLFFRSHGPFQCSKGVLLVGRPGCGKTMLMKAVARACGRPFFNVTLGTLQSKFYGESQKLLGALFAVAKRTAPCVVFVDEIDAAFRARSADDAACDYALKTEFLALMDGMASRADEAVIVVGATNNADTLDPALKRRMPVVIEVGAPTPADRLRMIARLCRGEPDPERAVEAYAELDDARTDGFSGSDVAEMYRAASRARLRAALAGTPDLARAARALPALTRSEWDEAAVQVRAAHARAAHSHCSRESPAAALARLIASSAAASRGAVAAS